jgi:cholesterol oxidase
MLDRTPPGTPEKGLHGPSDTSYMRLAARLDGTSPKPSFLILAGDQVYVDATAGLFDPKVLDDRFRLPYENFLGGRGPRSVLSRLPAHMVLDDHEIEDNWEPDPPFARVRRPLSNQGLIVRGVQAFWRYQRDTAPAPGKAAVLWLDQQIGGFPFFLADSRTDRSPRTVANVNDADLFGEKQAAAIDGWLRSLAIKGPRFLVTGCIVLPRQLRTLAGQASSLRSDAWDGYPRALHRLLAGVFERGRDDVVFLSGDAHLGNVTKIVLTKSGSSKKVVAHSIHCPALYAPYPFANAIKEDFAGTDCFTFNWVDPIRGVETYGCSVETWFPTPGDGFVVLTVVEDERRWSVTVKFDNVTIPRDSGDTVFNFEISKP